MLSCLDRGALEREERSEGVQEHVPLVRVDVQQRLRIPAPAVFLIGAAAASDIWPRLGCLGFAAVKQVVTVALAVIRRTRVGAMARASTTSSGGSAVTNAPTRAAPDAVAPRTAGSTHTSPARTTSTLARSSLLIGVSSADGSGRLGWPNVMITSRSSQSRPREAARCLLTCLPLVSCPARRRHRVIWS